LYQLHGTYQALVVVVPYAQYMGQAKRARVIASHLFVCQFAELMVLIDYWHSAAFHGWDNFVP